MDYNDLWTFWEIRIFQNFPSFNHIKTRKKTTANSTKKETKTKNNDTRLKQTSNRGRNKCWMIRLEMLIHCYGHLKVMMTFNYMKSLVIDDGFLNTRT